MTIEYTCDVCGIKGNSSDDYMTSEAKWNICVCIKCWKKIVAEIKARYIHKG